MSLILFYLLYRWPSFGNGTDLSVNSNFVNKGGYSYFPNTFQVILWKGKSIFTENINNSTSNFKLKEIEVFKICKLLNRLFLYQI